MPRDSLVPVVQWGGETPPNLGTHLSYLRYVPTSSLSLDLDLPKVRYLSLIVIATSEGL